MQCTNPNAVDMLQHDTIFTNIGVTDDNQPWWEDLTAHACLELAR
ncbi:MAG: phosphoenolpyruvate carboxykinase domain-containing protein [Gammaproteobacteria bacterium]